MRRVDAAEALPSPEMRRGSFGGRSEAVPSEGCSGRGSRGAVPAVGTAAVGAPPAGGRRSCWDQPPACKNSRNAAASPSFPPSLQHAAALLSPERLIRLCLQLVQQGAAACP